VSLTEPEHLFARLYETGANDFFRRSLQPVRTISTTERRQQSDPCRYHGLDDHTGDLLSWNPRRHLARHPVLHPGGGLRPGHPQGAPTSS
jgi:hypothetical protein